MPSTCPACLRAEGAPGFSASDLSLRAVAGSFSYDRCAACGTVFAHPQPDAATLAQAYAGSYGNYRAEASLVERLAEPLARREAARVARRADPGSPLLDLGCGTGRFLERLQAVGWHGPLRGVEYAAEVADDASRRLGIPVAHGRAEEADLGPPGTLGVLVMRHVIEHLRSAGTVLDRARAALRPDGLLYVATPDTRALSAKAFGQWWWGYEVPRHLVVFSRDGLRALVRRHGYEVVDEWWSFAPQMWNASLGLRLAGRDPARVQRFTSLANPLVSGPAAVAGVAEVLARRSTMYGLLARRVRG